MRTFFFTLVTLTTLSLSTAAHAVTVNSIDTYLRTEDQCLGSMVDRYIWVRGHGETWQQKTLSERYKIVERLYDEQAKTGFKTLGNGPWDRALVPTFNAQRDALMDSMLAIETSGKFIQDVAYDEDGNILKLGGLETYLTNPQPTELHGIVEILIKAFKGKRASIKDLWGSQDADFDKADTSRTAIAAACAQMSMLNAYSCTNAVSEVLREARYHTNMILPKIWNEFVDSAQLRDGTRFGALKMIERIKSRQPGRVFDDLRFGFKRAGFNEVDATDATWKLLALYGNGGPNVGYRLTLFDLPVETSSLIVALSFIGPAITYLDFFQLMTGAAHYAFPREVSGCLTPKPYHFWLNAYFARSLVLKGYSQQVAQMATFIVSKGYQIHRDVNNAGGGVAKILAKPTDHPTNEVVRIDLTLAAAGNVYGSLVATRLPIKPLMLDQGMSRLQEVRGQLDQVSRDWLQHIIPNESVRSLRAWDQMFKPNEVLEFFRSQQN